MDPVGHEQGDNTGDEMLNVLEDVIWPTHELLVKDEHADNFETKSLQREKYDDLFVEMEIELYPGRSEIFLVEFFSKVDALKSSK